MNVLGSVAKFTGSKVQELLASSAKRFPKNMKDTSAQILDSSADINALRTVCHLAQCFSHFLTCRTFGECELNSTTASW